MPYKISGTKSETARVIIFKESDWTIESNTVISGSGAYEVDSLETGNKSVIARTNDGEVAGYGFVAAEEYVPATGDRGIFANHDLEINYITISTTGDATDFGDLSVNRVQFAACSNSVTGRGLFGGGGSYTNVIDYITILSVGNALDFGDLTNANRSEWSGGMSSSTRAVWAGGHSGGGTQQNSIEFVTIQTTGNATDFGDLTVGRRGPTSLSNGHGGL